MSGEFGIFIWSNKCGFDEYPSVCENQFWEVKFVSVEAVCFIPCCSRKSVGDKGVLPKSARNRFQCNISSPCALPPVLTRYGFTGFNVKNFSCMDRHTDEAAARTA